MAAPLAKKHKTALATAEEKHTIPFSAPGYQSDVRLQAFDQDFHLSSVPLKLHSAFSRKFLDSADKVLATVSRARTDVPPKFTYHWVTVIDGEENENWHLCDAQKVRCSFRKGSKDRANNFY